MASSSYSTVRERVSTPVVIRRRPNRTPPARRQRPAHGSSTGSGRRQIALREDRQIAINFTPSVLRGGERGHRSCHRRPFVTPALPPSSIRRPAEPPRLHVVSGLTDKVNMACSKCGFEGHNSRTCEGPNWQCPNCGRPTANMADSSERFDSNYCSYITSPSCWGSGEAGEA